MLDAGENDNVPPREYQIVTKMFYYIVISGLHEHIVERNKPIDLFTRRMAYAYTMMCKITKEWHEDEQYKADPRWKL